MGALNFDVLEEKKCKTYSYTLDLYTKKYGLPGEGMGSIATYIPTYISHCTLYPAHVMQHLQVTKVMVINRLNKAREFSLSISGVMCYKNTRIPIMHIMLQAQA